ncbi:MAG: methionyl-tRNA formyltransferase [Bacteroidaceae bacterium]|nr:methionyl-tRNA formyltransferase [Bacteroidaceae bacterium]
MRKEDLRIVYMGTPEFAVESLKQLVTGGYNVVGVVTVPDKPIGRHGSILSPSPVKEFAVSNGLKVLQPTNLKDPSFVDELRALNANLQIVVAFRMLPEIVWNMPKLGTFNLHASLLPQYRGAAPINWAVINGEKETGITTFFLKHEIDTGEIIQQVAVPIALTDNVGVVYDKLMLLGGQLVLETVEAILNESVVAIPQERLVKDTVLKPAPKIFKYTCCIHWENSTLSIYNLVRGLSPYPASWTTFFLPGEKGVVVKIYQVEQLLKEHSYPCGTILSDGKTFLHIATTDGFINVKELQMTGKKKMFIADFLRGYRLKDGLFAK